MNKKALTKSSLMILAVIGLILFVMYQYGGDLKTAKTSLGLQQVSTTCTPSVSLSLTEPSGSTKTQSGNNFDVVLTKSQLNSANVTAITMTLTTSVTSGCRGADGSFMQHMETYGAETQKYKNVDDLTDTTEYHVLQWIDNDNEYNVTIDGTSYAFVNQASDVITVGTDGSAAYTINVEDYTTLDKLVKNNYEKILIGKFPVKVDGTTVGSVNLYYMQTP